MPPEAISFARRAQPDELPEWMDEPCSYEEFRACLVNLAQVNTITLAARPTLEWLSQHLASHRVSGRPVHLVDVGCGGGDTLRRIARWSQRKGVAVKLTGIDLNPYATQTARELTANRDGIEWITGDAFSYAPAGGIDIVISSLFTHHLPDAEIVRFLAWMETVAKLGWFINDLRRSERAHTVFRLLARAMRWHRFVKHDGPVSIRRSFLEPDWQALCAAAGIAIEDVTLQRRAFARLCVGRWK